MEIQTNTPTKTKNKSIQNDRKTIVQILIISQIIRRTNQLRRTRAGGETVHQNLKQKEEKIVETNLAMKEKEKGKDN